MGVTEVLPKSLEARCGITNQTIKCAIQKMQVLDSDSPGRELAKVNKGVISRSSSAAGNSISE
jgi:hypothetical protein